VRGGLASRTHPLLPYSDWTVGNTFDTEVLCFKYVDLDINAVRVNNLPPPTVVRSGTPATQPATQPAQPVINTAPAPRDDDRRRRDDDRDDRRRRNSDEDEESKGIRKFFKDLFNDGAVDPSQAPGGASGPQVEPAPVDNKVKLNYKEDAPTQAVPKDDRTELIKLRVQPPIKEKWLLLNHLDVAEVRGYEKEEEKIIMQLNNVFGYISPSALWNQVDKLDKLAKGGAKKFKATLSSVIVTVDNTAEDAAKDGLQVVSDLHARVKLSIGFKKLQNIEKVKGQVAKLIGEEAYSKKSASNPYRRRTGSKTSDSEASARKETKAANKAGKVTA